MQTDTHLPQSPTLAATALIDIALRVEAAEHAIKTELLRAATAGDHVRVVTVLTRWLNLPSTEVLQETDGSSADAAATH